MISNRSKYHETLKAKIYEASQSNFRVVIVTHTVEELIITRGPFYYPRLTRIRAFISIDIRGRFY